jgi:transcriptional regulator with XRE-family HTH domain
MDKLNQRLAPKLRTLRLEKGYTLENMSEMLGLKSVSSYAAIEKGEADITLCRLEDIAKIFNLSALQLLQTVDTPTFNFHFQQGAGFGNNQSTIYVNEQRMENIEKRLEVIEQKLK